MSPRFPTKLHEHAANVVSEFLRDAPEIDTVLVVNSCARGKAVPESDLDMAALAREDVPPESQRRLEAGWLDFVRHHAELDRFRALGRFSHIHLDVFSGRFEPPRWDEGGGPDDFEIEIGNRVAHAAPLGTPGAHFDELRARWLPFYGERLRESRLAMVRDACAYDLDHVAFFVARDLPLQAFDRLYKAYREFLQALFIARRRYPIAYNKWLREQVVDQLELPELFDELLAILSVGGLAGEALRSNAERLRALLERWTDA